MNKEEVFNVFLGNDKVETYREFQKIENSIDESDELYEYFDEIKSMLVNEKSYIRVRGFRIICKLAKWDKENKINYIIDELLKELNDEKPTAVRQCLSALDNLIFYKKELVYEIKENTKNIDCSKYKDTMQPLIKKDIDKILKYYK